MGTLQREAHRLKGFLGGAERILVGSELDDLLLAQTEIAGEFLDGLAGLVDGQLQDMLMRGLPHGESLGEAEEIWNSGTQE